MYGAVHTSKPTNSHNLNAHIEFLYLRGNMDKVIVEKEVLTPVEGDSGTASNFIWAIAFIVIVGMIVGALYYSGFLRRITNQQPQKVNVEVSAPAAPPPAR
jgi:hypothetical protein